jgi:hypothetical protein
MMEAVEDGDDYIINGQKTFNTECHYSEYHWLAVRTDFSPDISKHQGITMFIVNMDTPGVTVSPMMTMSGEQTNEVFYDNVRVPKSRIVGEKNKGFYYVMEAIGSERNQVFIPARLQPILNELVQYVKNTKHNQEPLSKDPIVRGKIAQMTIELEIAGVLADHSRWLESNDMPLTYEPEVTKIFMSEAEQRIAKNAMQILGPYAQLLEGSKYVPLRGRVSWEWLHSFMTTLGGGTSEVGRSVIAQRGLGLPRSY